MWDGSAVPLAENLQIAAELLAKCAAAHIVMEMEIGVVGGEEDGVVGEVNEKLYTTPEDALATAEAVGLGERGRYILRSEEHTSELQSQSNLVFRLLLEKKKKKY